MTETPCRRATATFVPALGLHLGQDVNFRGTQIDATRVSRLQITIRKRRYGPESTDEAGQALPSRLYAQMADHTRFGLTPFFDRIQDGMEDFFGGQRVAWKYRAILDVIKTTVVRVRKLQHYGAAGNFFSVG